VTESEIDARECADACSWLTRSSSSKHCRRASTRGRGTRRPLSGGDAKDSPSPSTVPRPSLLSRRSHQRLTRSRRRSCRPLEGLRALVPCSSSPSTSTVQLAAHICWTRADRRGGLVSELLGAGYLSAMAVRSSCRSRCRTSDRDRSLTSGARFTVLVVAAPAYRKPLVRGARARVGQPPRGPHTRGEATCRSTLANRPPFARCDRGECRRSCRLLRLAVVDGCEQIPSRSRQANVGTVQTLLDAIARPRRRVVFYSTDHVFDGSRNPAPRGTRPAVERLRGTNAKRGAAPTARSALVVRTAWVFARSSAQELRVPGDRRRTGRAAADLPVGAIRMAHVEQWLAERRSTCRGRTRRVIHWPGPQVLTKAEWAHCRGHARSASTDDS